MKRKQNSATETAVILYGIAALVFIAMYLIVAKNEGVIP